jgi:hypothetical protein
MQVACKELGPHDRGGLVLGIDIQEVRGRHPACAVCAPSGHKGLPLTFCVNCLSRDAAVKTLDLYVLAGGVVQCLALPQSSW